MKERTQIPHVPTREQEVARADASPGNTKAVSNMVKDRRGMITGFSFGTERLDLNLEVA